MKKRGEMQFPPPEFGTTPIPAGMVRFNHYTNAAENLPNIMEHGLQEKYARESFARGGTESPETFATAGEPKDDFKHSMHYVEGYADPGRGKQLNIGENWRDSDPAEHAAHMEAGRQTITMRGDIPASQMIAAHEPWHETFRYIARDPSMEKPVMAGDYDTKDWASPDHKLQQALDATTVALSAKVMLGGGLRGQSYEDQGMVTERSRRKTQQKEKTDD